MSQPPEEVLAQIEQMVDGDLPPEDRVIKYPVLFIWSDVLSNIEKFDPSTIEVDTAVTIVGRYSHLGMSFADVPTYFQQYNDYLVDMRSVVHSVESSFPDYMKNIGDEDAAENREAYLNVLLLWQQQVREWEKGIDFAEPGVHTKIAAINDATGFTLGAQGMVALLDQINFNITPEETEELQQTLMASAQEAEGE